MPTVRQEKVANLIRKELSIIFQQEARASFRGAMITVTIVRMSPDLSSARVFLSIFAPGEKKDFMTLVDAKASEIRKKLGNKVRNQLRIVPNLNFILDDSLDYAEKIDDLLK